MLHVAAALIGKKFCTLMGWGNPSRGTCAIRRFLSSKCQLSNGMPIGSQQPADRRRARDVAARRKLLFRAHTYMR
jgi:hypothetical protein